ncbi:MAG: NnrS family protein, partial [Bdellovibrionales bacterium]|nr:NnrS family protein [Bdellovibrionales bacterium]
SSTFWHGHEMIFGFSGALLAGFLLTAAPGWTKSTPYQGRWLALLIALWSMERLSFVIPINRELTLILMNLFFPALAIMLYLTLQKFPKHKYVFIPIFLGIIAAKLFYTFGHIYQNSNYQLYGQQMAVGLIRFILLLMAGRQIPLFMRKKFNGIKISIPTWLNSLTLAPIIILAFLPSEITPKAALAGIYLCAIMMGVVRQAKWLPHRSIKTPIIAILHTGAAFIYLGLILELLALYYPQISLSKVPMHALMAGGLATLAIGIMTRISLGHTGSVVKADRLIILAYLAIILGALLRITTPIFLLELYIPSLYLSTLLWALGFLFFLLKFTRKFVTL